MIKRVLQDHLLSLLLFAMFTPDIDNYFRELVVVTLDNGKNIRMLLHTDDLVLSTETPIHMENNLQILKSYCNHFKLLSKPNQNRIIP